MAIDCRLVVPALGAILLVSSCAPQDGTGAARGDGGTGSDGGAKTPAGQACLDTADAFGKAQQRCGTDYATARDGLIRDLANGDCETVTIRNERELRTQCFPSLSRISCSDLGNGRLDPSCAEQLIRFK